ncbi:MAG: tRNA (N6-threonylcarbamoyladenosine(37)-N6)-methyltransferase TrmO [Polyangiaceae bacterium]|nr:tRNA (N6-threonylcarbamoyladenosine(37)-N6)-methyltransferase TrmO [Polyangiaceae bacterium]MCW5788942.1 tRNA (N6-threonylcarbamoyladenosine(37)-N6)-methyltransferase TrmO [Polyangiaceae bacterium]
MSDPPLTLRPIGIARTPYQSKAEAPRQAPLASGEAQIVLLPRSGFEHALEDLTAWSHLWVLAWLDRAGGFAPKVRPPRSQTKRGVLATRSPHRPNPIGLSAVRLLQVRGLTLTVSSLDLIDGTPILDLKPYVPYSDCIPEANSGWLEAAPTAATPGVTLALGAERLTTEPGAAPSPSAAEGWRVEFASRAERQLALLGAEGEALRARLVTLLEPGPSPHPYRRIRQVGDHARIAVGPWRARFTSHRAAPGALGHIRVEAIATGYRRAELARDPSLEAHQALVAAWGYPGDEIG